MQKFDCTTLVDLFVESASLLETIKRPSQGPQQRLFAAQNDPFSAIALITLVEIESSTKICWVVLF